MAELTSTLSETPNPPVSKRLAPWLLSGPGAIFFLTLLGMPLLMTLVLSFNSFDYSEGIISTFTLNNYLEVLTDSYFHEIFLRTYGISVAVVILCILIGVPEAYILSRMRSPWRSLFLVVTLAPLLISVVVRTLGWVLLIGGNGLLGKTLEALGLAEASAGNLMYTHTGVIMALVHVLVPFMVISVWAALQKLDPAVENASLSLGASHSIVFRRIVIPQILPGILSGSLIVFALSASAFATPAIIGGRRLKVAATAAYDEYLNTMNWPLGAAIAFILLVANVALVMTYNRMMERRFRRTLG
ncbi:ABC transporter permease [Halomonas sp. McH1-25]|uniref:ABC transporter permease n=1 Tax=unclassified Halomonas TaxID=2609666 RepID=UPI001EF52904|nr:MULTISPECIES: ABC transporter permease [unclassified Halomonas]MCG7601128.1 ABC transporter permease [Halomonas sp. McH1-25]MCP1344577.1 ABC transporter permease [Halomonas sp. FL8]MCP1362591.1 ABC transporter permease [Halomonas sp. BBD45]MCP1363971.1 ABC transporter permease [Halomonas sp. BBD48]